MRHLLSSSLVLTVAFAARSANAQTSWPIVSGGAGVEARMDERGNKATAIHDRDVAVVPPTAGLPLPANWTALGPFGGDVDDVQASPTNANVVLAGLAPASGFGGGMYRSTNAGVNWNPVASLSGRMVHDIAFAPNGTCYCGTIDAVWKSTDDGATFTQLPLGIGLNDQVFEVSIDPSNAMRIWIGIADALGNQAVNVMLSTNGGTSWNNMTPPLSAPMSCTCIAVDPANSNNVYAGFGGAFGGGQVWVSTNGGTSWTNRSAGLPNTPVRDIVHDGARVLVTGGQLFGSQNFGLFWTNNAGVTWNPMHDGTWPTLVLADIAFEPGNVNTIYVASTGKGLFRSINGGLNWSFQVGGTGSLSINAVSYSPGSTSVIYTGASSNAVWKSTNSGTSFNPSSTGISSLDVYSIASNPQNERELAIAFQGLNDGGVYTTTNAGANWSLAALPGTRYNTVYFSPAGQLFSISDGPSSIAPEGLYRRSGAIWTSIGPDQGTLFESELYPMRVSANNPNFIVAGGADFGVAGFEQTLWRTTNGGGMWTKTYEGTANAPVQDLRIVDEATDTTMLAVHTDQNGGSGGALRSIDGGMTWAPSNTGFTSGVQPSSLAVSPLNVNTFYASSGAGSTSPGVFVSTDAGQSWNPTGFLGSVREVETDVTDPSVLYIAQFNNPKVQVSINSGLTFSAYDTGLATAGSPRDLQRARGAGSDLLLAVTTGSYATDLVSPSGAAYCTAGTTTNGCVPSISGVGSASATAGSGFTITVVNVEGQRNGLLFYGISGPVGTPWGATGPSYLCVKSPTQRMTNQVSGGTSGLCDGTLSEDWNAYIAAHPTALGQPYVGGETVYAQAWFRDPPSAKTTHLSRGLVFGVAP